jgi:hypothetical protein
LGVTKTQKHKNKNTNTNTNANTNTKRPEEKTFSLKIEKTKHFFLPEIGTAGDKRPHRPQGAHFSLFCGFTRMATEDFRVVISSDPDSEGDDPTYRAPFPFFGPASRARF